MLGIYVSVPVACFRNGLLRERLETEAIPPPATCYGFLLSLVGETQRSRHLGCRVTPVLLGQPKISVVLRSVWRVKNRMLGHRQNTRPDYQQLLTEVELVIWIDSSSEVAADGPNLEARIASALADPASVTRFGGLCLGESTHLVNDVLSVERATRQLADRTAQAFLLAPRGRMTLPIWVDHVGSSGTRFAVGNLVPRPAQLAPKPEEMPCISREEVA